MSPPQLARDRPVMDVVHPVQINLAVVVGDNRDLALLDGRDRFLRQRCNLYEPLLRKPRFNDRPATVALTQGYGVSFSPTRKALLLQIF